MCRWGRKSRGSSCHRIRRSKQFGFGSFICAAFVRADDAPPALHELCSILRKGYINSLSSHRDRIELEFDGSDTKRFDELGNLNAVGDIGANLPGADSPFKGEMTDHGVMDRIAAETGGKAFYNTNGLEQAMTVAMEQETNYYVLSYSPTNKKYDGKFRRIKVSLGSDERKLHVIHRSGYFAVDPESGEYLKDAAKGFGLVAMQHGSPQAHQIFFVARVVPIGKPQKVSPTSAGIVLPVSKKKRHEQHPVPPELVEMQRYIVDYAVAANQLHFDGSYRKHITV